MPLRVTDTLSQLTLHEKASLTSGSSFWYTTPVPRLGIPKVMVSDGPHGLRAQPGDSDHVGLGESLPATCFPTASAIASSWNPALLRRVGEALGREARACHVSVILGPGVNIKRSPLCGRNFEYLSEDPYLAGELGLGIVDGIQSIGVGTSVKHFAANNQEHDRFRVDTIVSERALREIYFPAFERIITAGRPWTVMCSYNKVNGLSASENPWLLTTVLRQQWGYQGLVVSDWGAVYHRVPALRAGTDLEMPPRASSPAEIVDAVTSGTLDETVLDQRVATVLELVSKAMAAGEVEETFDEQAHHQLAREVAAESAVLLKNDGGLLPLPASTRLCVIGEYARTPRFQGAGSSRVNPTRIDIALDELLGAYEHATFAPGYGLDPGPQDDRLRDEAATAAADADAVVLFLGLPAAAESEGFDRSHMNLPDNQLATLRAVCAANPRVAVCLVNGSTVLLDEVSAHAQAILELWLGGQGAGSAVADLLTGTANPSGRLAETIPHRLQDNPSYLNFPGDSGRVTYGEGIFVGYRGYDASDIDVAYPFGFGLSYTTFETTDLTTAQRGSVVDGDLTVDVSVTVTNTGPRRGAHVAQTYVRDVAASVARPLRELKGFAKITLDPGDSTTVSLTLDQRAFSYWSDLHGDWVVEPGQFDVQIGANSRTILLTEQITIDGPSVAAPLTADSTLLEWLHDPAGSALLAPLKDRSTLLPDEQLVQVIGTMPMSTLAGFGQGLDNNDLHALVAALPS